MEVTYHVGAHSTAADRLLDVLRANADALAQEGVSVAHPDRFRPAVRDAMLAGRGQAASESAQRDLLAAMGVEARPAHLVLSSDSFLCVPRRAVEAGVLYPTAAERAGWMRALFPEARTRICVALRNPVTWLPAVHARFRAEMPLTDWLGDLTALSLSWVDLLGRLHAAVPDAEIVVWCHEDMPLILPEILDALIGRTPAQAMQGLETPLSDLLLPEATAQLAGFLQRTPDPSERRAACHAFLQRFARPDALAGPVRLPVAPGEDVAAIAEGITETYERDVADLRSCPEVTFLAP